MPYDKEIVVVDDGSLDGTRSSTWRRSTVVASGVFQGKNAGKGAVVSSGIKIATGDSIIIGEQGNGKKRVPGNGTGTSRRRVTQPTRAYE